MRFVCFLNIFFKNEIWKKGKKKNFVPSLFLSHTISSSFISHFSFLFNKKAAAATGSAAATSGDPPVTRGSSSRPPQQQIPPSYSADDKPLSGASQPKPTATSGPPQVQG